MKQANFGEYLKHFAKKKANQLTAPQVQEMFKSLLNAKLTRFELDAFHQRFEKDGAVPLDDLIRSLRNQAPFSLKTRIDDVVRTLSRLLKQSSLTPQKVFTRYDKDMDDFLQFHELLYALEQLHVPLSHDEAIALEKYFKSNRMSSQGISRGQFLRLTQRAKAAESDQTKAQKSLKIISRVLSQKYQGNAKLYFGDFALMGGMIKRRDFKNAVLRLQSSLTMEEIDNLTDYLDALQGEGMISLQGLVELLSNQGLEQSVVQSELEGGPSVEMQPRTLEDLSRSGIA